MATALDLSSPLMPKSPTMKLNWDNFRDLWWVARIERKSPGDLIEELCAVAAGARRKRYEAEITKLRKLDEERVRVEEQARAKAAD